jgi:phosphoribosylglycinamide formyltransferase-1
VLDADTAETLAARVLQQEHIIYPAALADLAAGRIQVQGNRVIHDGADQTSTALRVPG